MYVRDVRGPPRAWQGPGCSDPFVPQSLYTEGFRRDERPVFGRLLERRVLDGPQRLRTALPASFVRERLQRNNTDENVAERHWRRQTGQLTHRHPAVGKSARMRVQQAGGVRERLLRAVRAAPADKHRATRDQGRWSHTRGHAIAGRRRPVLYRTGHAGRALVRPEGKDSILI